MESINISDARARLPQIARALVKEPGSVVYLEHRDLEDRLAVTTESHLRYLETLVAELQRRNARPFRLAGSIEAGEDAGDAIDALRAEAARAEAERLGGL